MKSPVVVKLYVSGPIELGFNLEKWWEERGEWKVG